MCECSGHVHIASVMCTKENEYMSDETKQDTKQKPSNGQIIAGKFRKESNDMSESERERNFRSAMSLIYGGTSPAHASRSRG